MANNNKKKGAGNAAVNIRNKRATFDYEILDTYTAGMVLTGTEIKSLRAGKAGLTDSYCLSTMVNCGQRMSISPNISTAPIITTMPIATANCFSLDVNCVACRTVRRSQV